MNSHLINHSIIYFILWFLKEISINLISIFFILSCKHFHMRNKQVVIPWQKHAWLHQISCVTSFNLTLCLDFYPLGCVTLLYLTFYVDFYPLGCVTSFHLIIFLDLFPQTCIFKFHLILAWTTTTRLLFYLIYFLSWNLSVKLFYLI